jgi:hypothetical protein
MLKIKVFLYMMTIAPGMEMQEIEIPMYGEESCARSELRIKAALARTVKTVDGFRYVVDCIKREVVVKEEK